MIIDFYQYYEKGKHAAEFAVVQAIPGVYNYGFSMITSGDVVQAIFGVLMLLGISLMLLYGVWKVVAKVLWRQTVLD